MTCSQPRLHYVGKTLARNSQSQNMIMTLKIPLLQDAQAELPQASASTAVGGGRAEGDSEDAMEPAKGLDHAALLSKQAVPRKQGQSPDQRSR